MTYFQWMALSNVSWNMVWFLPQKYLNKKKIK